MVMMAVIMNHDGDGVMVTGMAQCAQCEEPEKSHATSSTEAAVPAMANGILIPSPDD